MENFFLVSYYPNYIKYSTQCHSPIYPLSSSPSLPQEPEYKKKNPSHWQFKPPPPHSRKSSPFLPFPFRYPKCITSLTSLKPHDGSQSNPEQFTHLSPHLPDAVHLHFSPRLLFGNGEFRWGSILSHTARLSFVARCITGSFTSSSTAARTSLPHEEGPSSPILEEQEKENEEDEERR